MQNIEEGRRELGITDAVSIPFPTLHPRALNIVFKNR
jgi:hypothetical protein